MTAVIEMPRIHEAERRLTAVQKIEHGKEVN